MYINAAYKHFVKYVLISILLYAFGVALALLGFLTIEIYLVFLAVAFTLLAGFYFLFFAKPLHKVTSQIAALIAGSEYKKINVKSNDEFGLIAHFFNDVTKNVENISFYLKEGERMASELAIASDIQKSVLPESIPMIPKLDTVAKTRPAEEVGGDSFDIDQKGSEYFIYVGDVTGHGAPAGLIMMMVNTLFDVMLPNFSNTLDLAVNINKVLKPRVNQTMFMTTSFFRWDTENEQMYYTGCGHEHILIYRAEEGVCEAIPAGGVALAMADDISEIVQEKQLNLSDQDVIVLYSDGITEAVNENGELFGLERLKESVKQSGHLGSSLRVFEAISTTVQNFVGDTIQNDDMNLLVMRYVPQGYEPDRPENLVSTKWMVSD